MFSRQARRYAKRFRTKGLDRAQRIILNQLLAVGIEGGSVLEVGCGVGGLHISLLMNGAGSATGVDLSEGMINEAKQLSNEFGVADKVNYLCGDLVSTDGEAKAADIVVLDKVLCCYVDPKTLIKRSTSKTNWLYAVSYPRGALLARIGFVTLQSLGTWLRWSFHPFYHEPLSLIAAIKREGFLEIGSGATLIWQVKLFRRDELGQKKSSARDEPMSSPEVDA